MQLNAAASPRYAALLELLRTADAVWNASRVFFARWDLHPSQFNVLNLLRDQPDGLTQTQLSRTLIMHRSNLTGLVDQLEARNLVKRHEAPGDRRSWHVVLTPAGQKLLRTILPAYYESVEAACEHLPTERARALAGDLERIRQRALDLNRTPNLSRS
jgi:DNA-binding MarR family transcriptional regulator